tara:strand:- start:326 stop:454 length:129 start_codon:yes stop_codon:yes gene_type:complete
VVAVEVVDQEVQQCQVFQVDQVVAVEKMVVQTELVGQEILPL